jgi:hypothetical protein
MDGTKGCSVLIPEKNVVISNVQLPAEIRNGINRVQLGARWECYDYTKPNSHATTRHVYRVSYSSLVDSNYFVFGLVTVIIAPVMILSLSFVAILVKDKYEREERKHQSKVEDSLLEEGNENKESDSESTNSMNE